MRHFGVATAGGFSSFTILKLIRDIVASNRDIKVWNLSLGSAMEINPNFISPEAAELDRIQCEYDVIFVVAGTNRGTKNSESIQELDRCCPFSINLISAIMVEINLKELRYVNH